LLSTWPIASGGSKVSKRLGASKVQSGNRCRAAWLAALWAPGCKSHSWDQQAARLKAAAKAFAGSEQSVPSASPHFCNSLLYFSSVFSTVPKRAPFGFILENGKTKWFRQSDVTKPYDGLHTYFTSPYFLAQAMSCDWVCVTLMLAYVRTYVLASTRRIRLPKSSFRRQSRRWGRVACMLAVT